MPKGRVEKIARQSRLRHGMVQLWHGTERYVCRLRVVTHVSRTVIIRVPWPSFENLTRHVTRNI